MQKQEHLPSDTSLNSPFSCRSYVFDPRPTYPLLSAIKQYWIPNSPHANDPDALTLVLAHGVGFHKEQWEPTMEDLQALIASRHGSPKLREIWSIDAPNHGDSAILNEEALRLYEDSFPWDKYARSIHLFICGLGNGVGINLTRRNLVGIGHSFGTVALALSMGYYPKIRYTSLIMCEVMIAPNPDLPKITSVVAGGSEKRRDVWPSREDAYRLLRVRGTWKAWDDRVLQSYMKFGLRPLPSAEYPEGKGVTLKCTRRQETATYRNWVGTKHVYHAFDKLVKQVPTHLIFGAMDDLLSTDVKIDIIHHRAGGLQNLASLSNVPQAGHLIVQMNPSGLAEKIHDALVLTSRSMSSAQFTAKL